MKQLSVVFAGGGCRTLWALGVQASLADLAPISEFAGVSAGAAMALAVATGQVHPLIEVFSARTAANRRNVYPERALTGRPIFPQEAMYRATMVELLDAAALARLAAAPRVKILQAYVEPGRPIVRTVAGAWSAYAARRRRGMMHGPEVPFPGIVAQVDTAQEADSVPELVDRVMRSSASPPVTPILRVGDRTYFDGSLVDAVPVRALGDAARAGPVVVLLNRPHPRVVAGDRLYLAPSGPVPIHKWDYASPERVRLAFDHGRRDGEAMRAAVARFIAGERRPSALA